MFGAGGMKMRPEARPQQAAKEQAEARPDPLAEAKDELRARAEARAEARSDNRCENALRAVIEAFDEHEEIPSPERGIEGMNVADGILKERGAVGIVIGGVAEEILIPGSEVKDLKDKHKDVDVMVLSLGFSLTKKFEGGIDWWLPQKSDSADGETWGWQNGFGKTTLGFIPTGFLRDSDGKMHGLEIFQRELRNDWKPGLYLMESTTTYLEMRTCEAESWLLLNRRGLNGEERGRVVSLVREKISDRMRGRYGQDKPLYKFGPDSPFSERTVRRGLYFASREKGRPQAS